MQPVDPNPFTSGLPTARISPAQPLAQQRVGPIRPSVYTRRQHEPGICYLTLTASEEMIQRELPVFAAAIQRSAV